MNGRNDSIELIRMLWEHMKRGTWQHEGEGIEKKCLFYKIMLNLTLKEWGMGIIERE